MPQGLKKYACIFICWHVLAYSFSLLACDAFGILPQEFIHFEEMQSRYVSSFVPISVKRIFHFIQKIDKQLY